MIRAMPARLTVPPSLDEAADRLEFCRSCNGLVPRPRKPCRVDDADHSTVGSSLATPPQRSILYCGHRERLAIGWHDMSDATEVGSTGGVAEGNVVGVGKFAVGNNGQHFAVTRRCRHLRADLADGSIDEQGCLVCPWHGSRYDVTTGKMVLGPQGVFAKVPGLGAMFKAITSVMPLGRGTVTERDGKLWVE